MLTIIITTKFHNHTDHIVYTGGMTYHGGHQKGVDNQIKQRWIFLCLHLSSIFGHNVTHALRQSLTLFTVFKQGTRLSKSFKTSRRICSYGSFSFIFNENIIFNDIIGGFAL